MSAGTSTNERRQGAPLRDGTVLVTGIEGHLGQSLIRRLHRGQKVIAMGSKMERALPPDVDYHVLDPLRSAARSVFEKKNIGAIVHMGLVQRPHAARTATHSQRLVAFQRVVDYAVQYQIPKIVLLSSAKVYGPRPENAQYLNEKAPLLASGSFSEMHTSVELDMYAQSCFWRSPEIDLVILRPVNILGALRNPESDYLRLPVVTTLLGFDPMVQAVHEEDVISAIECALCPGVRGIFNIAGPNAVPLSAALKLLGRRTVSVPHSIAKGGLTSLFRLGVSKFPAPELDFIRYVCMVDDSSARRDLGYHPALGLKKTFQAVDRERWVA